MKKLLSILLALIMLTALAVPAFAATATVFLNQSDLSETLTFSKKNAVEVKTHEIQLKAFVPAPLQNDGWNTFELKCLAEYQIKNIAAVVVSGGSDFGNVELSCGEKRESGAVEDGSTVHLDGIHSETFRLECNGATKFSSITVYFEPVGVIDENEKLLFAEYAEVGEGTYFDTGYIFLKLYPEIVMDVDVKSDNETWFGIRKETIKKFVDERHELCDYVFYYYSLSNNANGIACGFEKNYQIIGSESVSEGRHTVGFNKTGIQYSLCIDGEERYTFDRSYFPGISLYLFGNHVYEDIAQSQTGPGAEGVREYVENTGNVTFYSCRIYKGNTLVHNYIPAVVESSGQPVIYDTVTEIYKPYSGNANNVVSHNLSEQLPPSGSTISVGNTAIVAVIAAAVAVVFVIIKKKQKA